MSVTREEVEQTVSSFQKIATRGEKKAPNGNLKTLILISVVVIVILAVGVYLYMSKNKKTLGLRASKSPEVASGGVPAATVNHAPQQTTVLI